MNLFNFLDWTDDFPIGSYSLKLSSHGDNYKINYSADDENGILNIEANGEDLNSCIEDLFNKIVDKVKSVEKIDSNNETEDLKEYCKELEEENRNLMAQNEELEADLDDVNEAIKYYKKTYQDMKEYVNTLEESKGYLEADNEQLRNFIDDFAIDYNQMKKSMNEFENRFFCN